MGATAVLQIVIVAISGSIGLLADTLHNLGHLATTIPLIIAFRLGRRAPTRRYSFGLRRAEDLVGLLISLVIAISAGLIIWESLRAFVEPRPSARLATSSSPATACRSDAASARPPSSPRASTPARTPSPRSPWSAAWPAPGPASRRRTPSSACSSPW
jgi:hypothetical protein